MLRPSITPNWKAGRWVDRTKKHNWKQYLYRDLFSYVVLINPYIRPSGRVNKYLQTKAGINYVQPQAVNSGNECGMSCTVAVEKLNRLLFQLFLSLRISPLWPRPNREVSPPSKSWCLDWVKTGCHLLLREDFFQALPRHLSLGSSNSLLSDSAGSGVLVYTAFSFEESEVRISCHSPKSPCGFWSHASLSHLSTISLSLLSHHRNFFMISRHLQQFVPS